MFDINNKLNAILEKHKLLKKDLLKSRITIAIRNIISEYTEKYGNRIIVRGLKESAKGNYSLLKIISDYGEVIAVVDKDPFDSKIQFDKGKYVNIISIEQAKNLDCDVYVINSKYQGKNIQYEMTVSEKEYCIVDLYTEMRVRYGILLTKTYDEYENETDFSHNKTHEIYEMFKSDRNIKNLRKLLGTCLSNRDFITFYDVINKSRDLVVDNNDLILLKNEVDDLINQIKILINDRRENISQDIIVHWIDQVGFEELNNFPRLKRMLANGMIFKKAYAVTPYTIATEACIFYNDLMSALNKKNLEEQFSDRELVNSELYNNIQDNGFSFVITGAIVEDCMPKQKSEYTQLMTASSVHYWNMLNYMINSDKPIFGIVGCLAETHEPWMSPECNVENPSFEFYGSYKMSEEKIKTSARYYDHLINFFSDIFGGETVNIYMSDHGKWEDIDFRRYSNYAVHTILGITNIGMKGEISRLFSYRYFPELIEFIIRCANRKSREHVFGDMELRSSGFRATIRKRIEEENCNDVVKEITYTNICSGYIGIKTESETYIRLDNGYEIYYLENEEEINRINEEKYNSRIDFLRRKMVE